MIYTVTFSPSLDYVMYIPEFIPGRVNRSQREQIYPGGKGINVSIMLSRLGLPSKALGFVAGFTGRALVEMLERLGVDGDFIQLPQGDSRINVKVKSGEESDLNGQGPHIPLQALEALMTRLEALSPGDTLVLAGAVPASLPPDTYVEIMKRLSGRDVSVVVDATGDLLKNALAHRPFLIKPNNHELEELMGSPCDSRDSIVACARAAQELGARNVLVSMAGDGGILVTEQGLVLESPPPRGRVVNSVGAGDSLVAGLLAGLHRTGDWARAMELGLAAGSASAFGEWLAEPEQIAALLECPDDYGF